MNRNWPKPIILFPIFMGIGCLPDDQGPSGGWGRPAAYIPAPDNVPPPPPPESSEWIGPKGYINPQPTPPPPAQPDATTAES